MLVALLDSSGIGKTELGEALGVQYQSVNRWTKGKFPRDKWRDVALYFGLPPTYFSDPDRAMRLERMRREAFALFAGTELGRAASRDEMAILERVRFGDNAPSPELYAAWLLAMRGKLVTTPDETLADNPPDLVSAPTAKALPASTGTVRRGRLSTKK